MHLLLQMVICSCVWKQATSFLQTRYFLISQNNHQLTDLLQGLIRKDHQVVKTVVVNLIRVIAHKVILRHLQEVIARVKAAQQKKLQLKTKEVG